MSCFGVVLYIILLLNILLSYLTFYLFCFFGIVVLYINLAISRWGFPVLMNCFIFFRSFSFGHGVWRFGFPSDANYSCKIQSMKASLAIFMCINSPFPLWTHFVSLCLIISNFLLISRFLTVLPIKGCNIVAASSQKRIPLPMRIIVQLVLVFCFLPDLKLA